MRRMLCPLASLALGLGLLSAGCSNSKYTEQIEQQKLEISRLQEKNYQAEMEMSRQKAQMDQLSTHAAEAPPMDTGGSMLSGETAVVEHHSGGGGSHHAAATGGGDRMVLESEVLFTSGSTSLTKKGIEAVKGVAGKIKKSYAGQQVRVEGYSDNVPIKKSKFASNSELSKARAAAVAKVLVDSGISADLVQVVGLGESKPRASNATADGRAKNRRVEIVILP